MLVSLKIPDDMAKMEQCTECEHLKAENTHLQEELSDLQILYDGAVVHGAAVEDQLLEKNLELEKTQQRLRKELEEAANYVKSLLPVPLAGGKIKTDWCYVPSTELGGDAFGYHWIDPTNLALYLLDVCGHGVGAALLSASALNVLRTQSLSGANFKDPGDVLTKLNMAFQADRQNGMYFTLWYGVYNLLERKLYYASGGHPPALLVDYASSIVQRLSTKGMIVGCLEDTIYRTSSIQVPEGAELFVFSDGIFELTRNDGILLNFDSFVGIFSSFWSDSNISLKAFIDHLRKIQGKDNFDDDLSLLRIGL